MIYGFYHVCLANNWTALVKEQIQLIMDSGLYEKTDKIFVSCVGMGRKILQNMLPPKFQIALYNPDIRPAEVPLVRYIHELSKKEDFLCWYIHTKGVISGQGNWNVVLWRKVMEHFIIFKHQQCIDTISSPKCDVCGILIYDAWATPMRVTGKGGHFCAGNFWWSKSSYLRTLKSVFLNGSRWEAEFWFARRPSTRFVSFYQLPYTSTRDFYTRPIAPRDYKNKMGGIRIPVPPPKLKLL